MDAAWLAAGSAVGMGVVTALAPCPLALNVAAMSYVGRRIDRPARVLAAGLLYALGQMLAYVGLAAVLALGTLSVDRVARAVQSIAGQALGPLLIVVGMCLVGLLKFRLPSSEPSDRFRARIDALGVWGALPLGAVLALSFCPNTAAVYFLYLLPLAVKAQAPVLVPLCYGLGAAVPVLAFAGLVAGSAWSVGRAFGALAALDRWTRPVAGWLLIGVGIYQSLVHLFGILD